MIRRFSKVNGKWEWGECPELEEWFKKSLVQGENATVEPSTNEAGFSNVKTEDMIELGAVPVDEIIEKFNKEHGIRYDPETGMFIF